MIRSALVAVFAPDRQIQLRLTEVRKRSSENNFLHISRQLDLLNIGRLITLFQDQPAAEILQGDCLAVILRFPGAPGLELNLLRSRQRVPVYSNIPERKTNEDILRTILITNRAAA